MNYETQTIVYSNGEPDRVDRFLAARFSDQSRSQIQRLINEGMVLVNGVPPRKMGQMLEKGDQIEIRFPPPEPIDLIPEEIPLDVIYEDQNLLVVNKPAGMVVHPSPGHPRGTLVHAVLGRCPNLGGIGGKRRPGIVHRLDKNTSGIIIIAKNHNSHTWLQGQFKRRNVDKTYIALVDGKPATSKGRIIAPIYRDRSNRQRMAIAPAGKGKFAETEYKEIVRYQRHTLLHVHPLTGRTHQIRVHLSSIDVPVAGDRTYGLKNPSISIDRHFLHASSLHIRLPGEKQKMRFSAQLPPELDQILKNLKPEN